MKKIIILFILSGMALGEQPNEKILDINNGPFQEAFALKLCWYPYCIFNPWRC